MFVLISLEIAFLSQCVLIASMPVTLPLLSVRVASLALIAVTTKFPKRENSEEIQSLYFSIPDRSAWK